jgi:hypothetical protein
MIFSAILMQEPTYSWNFSSCPQLISTFDRLYCCTEYTLRKISSRLISLEHRKTPPTDSWLRMIEDCSTCRSSEDYMPLMTDPCPSPLTMPSTFGSFEYLKSS